MLKACTVVSLFIYVLLNSVSYAASLLGVASITVQSSVQIHETKSLYFGTFSNSKPFIDFTLDVSADTQLIPVDGFKNNGRFNLYRFVAMQEMLSYF